jgi:hypothetical protein
VVTGKLYSNLFSLKGGVLKASLFIGLLFGIKLTFGQTDITLSPIQPSDYQMHYDDLWRLSIIHSNEEASTYYYLEAQVIKADQVVWKAKTHSFQLQQSPFMILPTNLQQFEPIDVTFSSQNWHQKVTEAGGLFPNGKYKIRYRLIETDVNCSVAGQLVATATYDIHLKSLHPPEPLMPYNGDTLESEVVTFSWAPSFTILPEQEVRYELRVAEVRGDQRPSEAITNNELYFVKEGLRETQFVFPSSARTLVKGQQYAWQVVAYNSNHIIGYSSVWSFNIGSGNKASKVIPERSIYFTLNQEVTDHIYRATEDFLFFKFQAEYMPANNKLKYEVRNMEDETVEMSGTTTPLAVEEGYNTYSLDISGLNENPYLLEITNSKSETFYLKFKYEPQN